MTSRFDLSGRRAVVIGGTSGLGLAIARGLAEAGADVAPSGRQTDKVESACAAIEQLGRRALRHPVDAVNRQSLEELRDRVQVAWGGVDILVNSAGFTVKKPVAEVGEPEWTAVTASILDATARACEVFHPALRASARGRVINIASLGSFVAFLEVAPYCAAKSAVLSLTRTLACQWAKDAITVNAIAPGVFPTALNARLLDGTPRGREILLRTPMGRFGHPDELAGAAVLLASDAASFITGQCIAVDGGFLASAEGW